VNDDSILDIIGPPPDPPLTDTQFREAWDKFLALDLIGRKINYGCHGGDELKIRGTIEAVYPILDFFVAIKIKDGMCSPEGEGVLECWEPLPYSVLYLHLNDRNWDPPCIEGNIVLPPIHYPMSTSLEIGFVE